MNRIATATIWLIAWPFLLAIRPAADRYNSVRKDAAIVTTALILETAWLSWVLYALFVLPKGM